jgi:hypothetical protein
MPASVRARRRYTARAAGPKYFTRRTHASRAQLIAAATQAARDAKRPGDRCRDARSPEERSSDVSRANALRATRGCPACGDDEPKSSRIALEDLTVLCTACHNRHLRNEHG